MAYHKPRTDVRICHVPVCSNLTEQTLVYQFKRMGATFLSGGDHDNTC